MNNQEAKFKKQKGVALIITLVVLFLLSALAASLIFATQSEMWASANYRLMTQSRYAAEAGAQAALNYFENTYPAPTNTALFNMTTMPVQCVGGTCTTAGSAVTLDATSSSATGNYPHTPSATVQSAFNSAFYNQSIPGMANATYSVKAELLAMSGPSQQTWQITSIGSISNVKNATTQVIETVQSNSTPTFQYGLYATGAFCKSVIIDGGSLTDGYNSNLGAYGGANVNTSGGSVGSAGNVYISGGSHLDGNVYTPYYTSSGNCSGSVTGLWNNGGTVTGTEQNITPPNYQNPGFTSPYTYTLAGSGYTSYTSAQTLTQGTYNGIATSGGGSLLTFSGGTYILGDVMIDGVGIVLNAGTYYVNSFTASGGANVTIASGPVILVINPNYNPTIPNGAWPNDKNPNCSNNIGNPPFCPFDVQGGSSIVNNLSPAMFEIEYGGTSNIVLSGGSHAAGVVYAPSAAVTITGGSPWSGGIIGKTIDNEGGSAIHYDTALQSLFPLAGGGFAPVAFSWSKN